MIYLIHGENLSSSRQFISDLQTEKNADARVELNILELLPDQLLNQLNAIDMFGSPPFIVLDISKVGRKKMDAYIDVLLSITNEATLVILSSKELSKANAFQKNSKKLGMRVVLNKRPKVSNVFKFVDYVFSGNRDQTYKELSRLLLSGEDPFYLFSMLVYGLRNISYVKFDSPNSNKIPPFIKNKVVAFSKKFSEGQVLEVFNKFYLLDKGVKTGVFPSDLLVPLAVEKVLSFF